MRTAAVMGLSSFIALVCCALCETPYTLSGRKSLKIFVAALMHVMHPMLGQKGLFLDPGEVAFALLRRHAAADFEKMPKHVLLTLHPQLSCLGQFGFDLGGQPVSL